MKPTRGGISQTSAGGVPDAPTINNATFTGAISGSQATGLGFVLANWGVPVILASSGTMGNNGAVSGMTALPATFSGGAWLYLPANAIDGSSAAGFYWFVASSTTAGTVYNSTFAGTGIPVTGTATPFVTTGPGAFTGIAAGEIVAATVTIPANALGANGSVVGRISATNNTAAGNKTFRIRYSGGAGTAFLAVVYATNGASGGQFAVRNMNAANIQAIECFITAAGNATGGVNTQFTTADTTGATTIVFTLEKATATNHAIWLGADLTLTYKA